MPLRMNLNEIMAQELGVDSFSFGCIVVGGDIWVIQARL